MKPPLCIWGIFRLKHVAKEAKIVCWKKESIFSKRCCTTVCQHVEDCRAISNVMRKSQVQEDKKISTQIQLHIT